MRREYSNDNERTSEEDTTSGNGCEEYSNDNERTSEGDMTSGNGCEEYSNDNERRTSERDTTSGNCYEIYSSESRGIDNVRKRWSSLFADFLFLFLFYFYSDLKKEIYIERKRQCVCVRKSDRYKIQKKVSTNGLFRCVGRLSVVCGVRVAILDDLHVVQPVTLRFYC